MTHKDLQKSLNILVRKYSGDLRIVQASSRQFYSVTIRWTWSENNGTCTLRDIHKLCRLKFGHFWSLSHCLFYYMGSIYKIVTIWGYLPPPLLYISIRHSFWMARIPRVLSPDTSSSNLLPSSSSSDTVGYFSIKI